MEKREIVALLEALCDRPLGAGGANDPAQLQALCRGAADVLARAQPDRSDTETVAETDRLTALLANGAVGSGVEEADRALLAETLAGWPTHQTRGVLGAGLSRRHRGLGTAGARRTDRRAIARRRSKQTELQHHPAGLIVSNGKWKMGAKLASRSRSCRLIVRCRRDVVALLAARLDQSAVTCGEEHNAPCIGCDRRRARGATRTCDGATVRTAPRRRRPSARKQTACRRVRRAKAFAKIQIAFPRRTARWRASRPIRISRQPRARAEAARAQAEAAAKVGAAQTGREPAEGTVQADKAARPFLEPEGRRPAAARAAPSYPAAR